MLCAHNGELSVGLRPKVLLDTQRIGFDIGWKLPPDLLIASVA